MSGIVDLTKAQKIVGPNFYSWPSLQFRAQNVPKMALSLKIELLLSASDLQELTLTLLLHVGSELLNLQKQELT